MKNKNDITNMIEKALSVKNPHALLICAGIKNIENRTWSTKFRGRVYIHASASPVKYNTLGDIYTTEQCTMLSHFALNHGFRIRGRDKINSAIIGHVDIVDCVINYSSIWAEKTPKYLSGLNVKLFEQMEGIKPIYNWVLANPVLFDKPILDVKGKLSFWNCSTYLEGQ